MKYLFSFLALAILVAPGVTLAHNVYDSTNTKVVAVIEENVWRAHLEEVARRSSAVLQTLKRGASIVMNGITETCPTWYPMDCVVTK